MKQRELGNTGLMFKSIGLGAMPLSISGRPDEAQAFAVIEAFVADGAISSTPRTCTAWTMTISATTSD